MATHSGSLFNDTVKSPDSVTSNDLIVDNELEKKAPFSLIESTFPADAWSKNAENLSSTKFRSALEHIYPLPNSYLGLFPLVGVPNEASSCISI